MWFLAASRCLAVSLYGAGSGSAEEIAQPVAAQALTNFAIPSLAGRSAESDRHIARHASFAIPARGLDRHGAMNQPGTPDLDCVQEYPGRI